MIQILLYANVLAFKRRVRDGEGEGSFGNKAPGFESSALPYSIFSLSKLDQHSQLENSSACQLILGVILTRK